MINDRISRITQPSGMGYRSGVSSKTHLRKIGRMYTSPSLDRLNSLDSHRSATLSRQKSIYDLTSYETIDTFRNTSQFSHRNSSLRRIRDSECITSLPIARPRQVLNGTDRYTGSAITAHRLTSNRSVANPLSILDRRDQFFSQLNAISSPIMTRRPLSKVHLINSSNMMQHKHHWSPTLSHDSWRARLRERPLLSNLTSTINFRSKSPKLSSGVNSRTSSTSSTTKLDESIGSEAGESTCGIIRNRFLIKFREREQNLGQTASQRRSSITWDLPKSFTTDVKASDESPISEDSEQNQVLESKDAESVALIVETKQKESVCEVLNKSDNSDQNKQELTNEEIIKELKPKQNITDKSVSNELQTRYNGSQLVIDILPIHTASVMPEPSGAQVALKQHAIPLIPNQPNDKTIKTTVVTTDKTPKKKKVKKKDVSKDKVAADKDKTVETKNNKTKQQDVVVKSDKSVVENNDICLKVCKNINENIVKEVPVIETKVLDLTPKRIKFRKYTFDDFNLIKVLGRGSFGKVLLAELKDHSVYFAIKCLKKHSVIEDDDIDSIMIERKVLAYGSAHPFICKLFCTFQTQNYLCFAMEWCCGGDLMFHVQKSGKFDENKARFYASEILCAVEFMHTKGIVYRDLKLDNIMIDQKGHLRLVDFGMCQGKIYREDLLPSNFCGTPEYMAPEIIKGVKYNQSVDFWSFGVLLYEMVVGTSPFHGTDEDELLWNVCYEEVNYPLYLSQNVKSILVLLLNKSPEQRLGMSSCPAGPIRSQPFFATVEWRKVEKCQIKPPFIPQLCSPFDVSYFDMYFTKEEPKLTPISEQITDTIDQTLFDGFSYTNHNMTD